VVPDIRYARSGDVSIAYQVIGDGPFDLLDEKVPASPSRSERASLRRRLLARCSSPKP